MANSERNPPLLACRSGVLTCFADQIDFSRNRDDERPSARQRKTPLSELAVIALKASIGLVTKPYVSGVGYIDSRQECKSFSCRDISSYVLFVPIRDDPEMVVNLGLRVAEAGLRRMGVAA
jgi:hypothetical protein